MLPLLGSLIAQKFPLDSSLLQKAALEARAEGVLIGRYLIEHHGVGEEAVYEALALQLAIPFLPSLQGRIDEGLLRELPIELFKAGRCFPLAQHEQLLQVVVDDPIDMDLVAHIEALCEVSVEMSVSIPSEMERERLRLFGDDSLLARSAGQLSRQYQTQLSGDESSLSLDEIKKRTESEPVVRLARLIFDEAIRLRASDVHIEPTEHNALVRFRIDGMLHQHMELTRSMYVPLTSRIKIQADLDIAEKRTPQDGRIRYEFNREQFDFRVSTLPTHHGEKTVVRILKHDMGLLEITRIGMPPAVRESMVELIDKPQGMVIVTGPTGSGKSSTLFSCLNRIRGKAINITTIENPIEYKLEGVNQVQVNEKAGNTFAAVLRSILRQDPDVILIGEIRDTETAQIAIQASQTGHLVFSTLHTNDALSAITRLRDLDIPNYLLASSLLGVLAQRLVRVLCPHCKAKGAVPPDTRARWEALFGEKGLAQSMRPVGCKKCGGSGFLGRTGVFELIGINEELRDMVSNGVSETRIRQYLRSRGSGSLIQHGIELIESGVSTSEELLRVVLVEDVMQYRNSSDKVEDDGNG
jgi:type IV pilus assembly protein PilB